MEFCRACPFNCGKSLTHHFSEKIGIIGAIKINSLLRITQQEITNSQIIMNLRKLRNSRLGGNAIITTRVAEDYPCHFDINTNYSQKEQQIRSFEDILRQRLGPEFWLENHIEPQGGLTDFAFGFVNDRVNDVRTARERSSDVLMTATQVVNTVDNARNALAYDSTDPAEFEENLICRIEDVVAFTVAMSNTTSLPGLLAVVHLFARTYYKKSTSKKVMADLFTIFDLRAHIASRTGEIEIQSGEDVCSTVFGSIREALVDWKNLRNGVFARKVAQAVSIFIAYGFLDEESLLATKALELFHIKAWDAQKDSIDFVEMAIDTFMFFIERGYAAITQRDLSLLLYDEQGIKELDKEYALLVGALPLLTTGELDGLINYKEQITDHAEYEVRLQKCNRAYSDMLKTETNSFMKNTLTNKLVVLSKVRTALILCQKSSCVREKPFAMVICGGSSVGKTMVNSILTKVCLHHNHFASQKENVVTLNDNDKYQSEYAPHHTAVTMDDFGNTRADKYDGSPTNKIIDFINNVPKAALKAGVEEKGNVMIQPKLVTVTTNVRHLLAGDFSNEPVSIMRRFELILDVRIRPEFVDPATKGLNSEMMGESMMPDAWEIDVNYVEIIREDSPNKADRYNIVPLKTNASITEVIEIVKEKSSKHFRQQKTFVSHVEDLYAQELCQHSFVPSCCPHCHFLQEEFDTLKDVDLANQMYDDVPPLTETMYDCNDDDDYDSDDDYVPDDVLERTEALHKAYLMEEQSGEEEIDFEALADDDDAPPPPRNEFSLEEMVRRANVAKHAYVHAKLTLEEAWADKIETAKALAVTALGLSVAVFTVKQLYGLFRKLIPQSSEVKLPKKLDTDVESPWRRVVVHPVPVSVASSTATHEQVSALLARSIGHMYVYAEGESTRKKCNIVPLKHDYWLAPSHIFEDRQYTVEVTTTSVGTVGKNFRQKIAPSMWYRVPDSDFVIICLPSGGDVPDIAKFLPTEDFVVGRTVLTSLYKNEQGELERCTLNAAGDDTFDSGVARFSGFKYQYPKITFRGLCMMTMVAQKKKPYIAGFHLAGYKDTCHGIGGKLTSAQLDDAIISLRARRCLETHSSGTFPLQKYGIDMAPTGEPIPPKNAVHWLRDEDGFDPLVEVWGSSPCPNRTFRSNVRKSIISDTVDEVMGIPKIHGKPQGLNTPRPWQMSLETMAHPKGDFEPDIWNAARDDLRETYKQHFEKHPEHLDLIHPYSDDAILSGMDGINAVDRVDITTSTGLPFNVQKKQFVVESDRKVEGISAPLDLDPQFWEEVACMEDTLAKGERIHTVFRANLKDEPTKATKNKVRVFGGCEFAFTLLVRKYYLSIIRVLQSNWVDFECAVGINAHGRDWSKLVEKLQTFPTDRMFAGDYKDFDKRTCPSATLSAFDNLIYIAELAGYTERQLNIMRGIATEICLPVYEYNGVFLKLFGSNPSGHALTVILNNELNKLYMRYVYYSLHRDIKKPDMFNTKVALICYGDDGAGSVSEEETKFNHTTVVEELAKVGITYTMADKSANSIPFIPLSEVSFLKRGMVFSEELQEWIAPIEEASIAKSLHNYTWRRGSIATPEEIAGDAVKSAGREFFLHGKDVYNVRITQLEKVVKEHNLEAFVGELPTYEMCVAKYLSKEDAPVVLLDPESIMLQ